MVEDAIGLDEVVVIGYGTQKKANLTGSVASITPKDIDNIPATQTSQLLTGHMAGVVVRQASGKPGENQGDISIRGLGTFSDAGNQPLVLVDGIPSSLNTVNPNDIASVSILKDAASASIYGARAANGVILITTKRGSEGKLNISYNGYIGWQKPTEFPNYLDSWEYAKLYNEAVVNAGQQKVYSDEEIEKFRNGTDPDNYPNSKYIEDIFESGDGFQMSHNINFNGGSKDHKFAFSLGTIEQNGLVQENSYTRYNFRLNEDIKLNKQFDLKINLSGNYSNQKEPIPGGGFSRGDNLNDIIVHGSRMAAVIPGRKSDGTYGFLNEGSPYAWLDGASFSKKNKYNASGTVNLNWNITKDLKISIKGGGKYNAQVNNAYSGRDVINKTTVQGPAMARDFNSTDYLLTYQSLIEYEKKIDNHNFKLLIGNSIETYRYDVTIASRDNFPDNSLFELNAGSENNMKANGSAFEWSLLSYFGRFNYMYNNKYLFETNVRYDGSSRFKKGNKYGLFPSFSTGWRVSEEQFLKNKFSFLSNMKIRASWGSLGNQNIGNYPYQYVIDLGQNYSWGGNLIPGAALLNLPSENITWEITHITDIGIDLSFFKNKLNFTFDYFNKKTEDILYKISTSSVLGLNTNERNAAKVENTGYEFAIDYGNKFRDITYGIHLNFSVINNKVISLKNLDMDIEKGLFVGESLDAFYGYVADGLFVDEKDVNSYAKQFYSPKPGDIRYKDISGPNGVPDGKVDAKYDRKVIGSRLPKYSFGATLTAGYKQFDFLIQLQGVADVDGELRGYSGPAFYHKGNAQKWHLARWTKANPNRNAKHPRVIPLSNAGAANIARSTFWMMDASYLRIKNIQIGYTIPQNISKFLNISKFRVYLSAQNLITFHNYYEGWDPEINSSGSFYPITAVYTFGLNINF